MKYFFIIIIAATLFWGCTKQSNGPAENYTVDNVFDTLDKNGAYTQQLLNNIYADMPTGFNRVDGDFLDAATDDAIPSRNGSNIQNIINANLSSNNYNPDAAWPDYYASIRKVNLFLSKVDVVPKPAEVVYWKAEARFLRSLFYFELLKRYGGIPLVGDSVFQSSDNIQLKRNTFDECVTYLVKECDSIKTKVRQEPISATDWGKASRGSVLALKSRILLYAASPLFNGVIIPGATAEQKAVMGYPTYDIERWNKAAIAANDLLALNVYTLEATGSNAFLNRKNNEVILPYLRGTTTDLESTNGPVGYKQGSIGNSATSPTQDLVNAFGMLNGKGITESGSNYNPLDPYTGRDPRLAATVLFNNAAWLSRPIETFEGGLDKPNQKGIQTKTGYYLRKFLGNFATATQYSAQNHNFPIFRIAETMLNYAEALNEYSGPTTAVYNTLINLRKRAGITAGTDGKYGLITTVDKNLMKDIIRNERRVEMAFEEQRYWDVRRWKLAETAFNKTLSGISIAKTGATTFTYQTVPVATISFPSAKMYLYPVPFSELGKNTNLIQNYGWQ